LSKEEEIKKIIREAESKLKHGLKDKTTLPTYADGLGKYLVQKYNLTVGRAEKKEFNALLGRHYMKFAKTVYGTTGKIVETPTEIILWKQGIASMEELIGERLKAFVNYAKTSGRTPTLLVVDAVSQQGNKRKLESEGWRVVEGFDAICTKIKNDTGVDIKKILEEMK
jgi:hypothetical protein